MTKQGSSGITKERLTDARRTADQAAWELLYALERLFPEKAAALRDIAEDVDVVVADQDKHTAQVRRRLDGWLRANNIFCRAVRDAAWRWGRGYSSPEMFFVEPELDEAGMFRAEPLVANPFRETRAQFMRRAGRHYSERVQQGKRRGFKAGASKHEVDHFRWLVKRLVGGKSWAVIAEEEAVEQKHGGNLDVKSIASEARKTALMIGLRFSSQRGPRKGTRHTPRVSRRDPHRRYDS